MRLKSALISLLFSQCFVSATLVNRDTPVTVHLKNGAAFQGVRVAVNNTEQFLGIPFAQPPVGNLRFKAPVAISTPTKGIQDASQFKTACPQPPTKSGLKFDSDIGAPVAEDCLFINIFRPAGTSAKDSLPVLVWLYSGGYTTGAGSNPASNPSRIIQRSVSIGKPIIFVSLNYRVNTFGFLASRFVAPEDLNAGLLDQQLALQFVQQNIASFGGEPAKVTCWGQSAGAGSCEAHVLFPALQNLFRSVITDSSTGPFKSAPSAFQYDEPGKPFASLVEAVGCPLSSESVACLQQIPFETLLNVSNTMINNRLNQQLWEPTVGPSNSLIPERPSERIASGSFRHDVAYMAGTNLNEGTVFSQSLINASHPGMTEDQALNSFLSQLLLDNTTFTPDVLGTFDTLFPANDPTAGGPFHTGDSLFDRAASWYTDAMFLAPRRLFFDKAVPLSSKPFFGYFFTEFIPGNNRTLGVFHDSELILLYGPVPTPVENEFANTLLDFWISFVADQNPGGNWPEFSTSQKQILQLMRDNITIITDDFDVEKTNFINSAKVLNEMEK
ncbi:alpha/beta-hydrolase [Schizopora paradoxa]|uniref:Alpha/beta-hydrolase n=1 Tax=Schizopora paradoxa TaxID=27342 RepID=A0A0H2RC61_9AGAM|nr:alpha/beta-hydrolase [Schizopora paradoxa]